MIYGDTRNNVEFMGTMVMWANALLAIEPFGRLTNDEARWVRKIHEAIAEAEDAKLEKNDERR